MLLLKCPWNIVSFFFFKFRSLRMVTDFLRSERYFGLFSLSYVLSVLDGYIVASAIVRFKVKRRIPRFRMREHLSTEPSLYGN